VLAIRAGQDAPPIGAVAGIGDEAILRTLLTAHGLTPRHCDLVVLDVQGARVRTARSCAASARPPSKSVGQRFIAASHASRLNPEISSTCRS